jgi:hypothetical protein
VFSECLAQGIVGRMNQAMAELLSPALLESAPLFFFESYELVTDARLAVFHTEPFDSPQLGKLQGNTYRKPNALTFVMPRTRDGAINGLAVQDQRINPGFGMLSIVAADSPPSTFLHEFGHDLGFPHAGNAKGVGNYKYGYCGGFEFQPPACGCEYASYMTVGDGSSFPATDGCPVCTGSVATTFKTPFFGPHFARILECWLSRRLDAPDVSFGDGDCGARVRGAAIPCYETPAEGGSTCKCPTGEIFSAPDCSDANLDARSSLAQASCPYLSCPALAGRPGLSCTGLAGSQIECRCEGDSNLFYMSDCSMLTSEVATSFCGAAP